MVIILEDAKEKYEWILNVLPEPFKSEFVEDILVDGFEYDD